MFFKDDLFQIKFIYLSIPKYKFCLQNIQSAWKDVFKSLSLYRTFKKIKNRGYLCFLLVEVVKNINPKFPTAKLLKFDLP